MKTRTGLRILVLAAFLSVAAALNAEPKVDGVVTPGEYTHQLAVIDGTATVSWSPDGRGGLYLAASAPTPGWVGLGLGSQVMDGASIFMGYVADGKPVFSEQKGRGHSHTPATVQQADQSAVASQDGRTVIEFHLPAAAVPGNSIPFITAYAGVPDLSTFHEDNLDAGTITLP